VGGMSPLAAALRAVAADVRFDSADRVRVGSREGPVAGAAGPFAGLAEAIYAVHYCRPRAPAAGAGDESAFLAALRESNGVPPRWEAWTIAGADPHGLVLAREDGTSRRAAYAESVPGPGGFAPGQSVRVPAVRELLTAPRGHYGVLGRPVADARSGRQVRFYWNLEPEGAAPFLAALTAGLDRRRIPFQAKVPAVPDGFGRADGGVLYLDCEEVEPALDVLAAAHRSLARWLRSETPLFARRLGRGLAFAESPPTGESFGLHRCRLVAEGLAEAFAAGAAGAEFALARFVRYGLDPEAPERNPATHYPYRFEGAFAA
jgi:HopA1 effector protein family